MQIELAMQSKAAPQGTSSLQTALSSAPQHPQAASVPPQADVQRQSAAAFPTSPSGSVSSASAPAQAYTAPSAESPESTQAPEQLAADLMQPSLNPTEATDPLPEEGAPAHAGPSPGDTIFDLAEFQVAFHSSPVMDVSQAQSCMCCMSQGNFRPHQEGVSCCHEVTCVA